jgi:D-glycerate 3-kinase
MPKIASDWPDEVFATIADAARGRTAPLVVGLCGPQGSGKSTAALDTAHRLEERGLSSAILSLDDLYLRRSERLELAERVHPLLATRGPPGTHDVGLGLRTLDALAGRGAVRLPRFDKAADDRAPEQTWPTIEAPVDCVLFEGWCVGARPQPQAALTAPINALEAEADADGRWRRFVNQALGGDYQVLFGRIDLLIELRAPSFEQVLAWRNEQEAPLRRTGGPGVMDEAQLARFIQHYERLTRWIDQEMPARADMVMDLAADRSLVRLTVR